jgi:Domain of Unknown Function with PDB structure (DUF3857)/Transglutaminase-like superfamily
MTNFTRADPMTRSQSRLVLRTAPPSTLLRTGIALCALLALGVASVAAQTAPRKSSARAVPAAPVSNPATTSAATAGASYRVAPRPDWVVDPEGLAAPDTVTAVKGSARRELLLDLQSNHALPKAQYHVRVRVAATDPAALASVSQPQIQFNPAYQTLAVHEAAVWRQGRKSDRLQGARLELMRREANLDKAMIDGTQTLMAVLNDVQVGDVVEVAYTVEGDNPIFEGRIGHVFDLASQDPLDHLHLRMVAPRERKLVLRQLATTIEAERFDQGANQVVRVVRRNVPAVVQESNTPPWFKVYPSIQISDYRDWAEVDAWAQRLFAPARVAGPLVQKKIAELKASGLEGHALVSEALRFVQDEIRYFSASLGVSSHRPKAAEATLAERLGDCKDKTILLVTMLEALGIDAKPALVSMYRNRGVGAYAAGYEQFDHVITRAVVDGTTYWLDATVNGQGLELATRGQYPYGMALVIGANRGELDTVVQPSLHTARIDYAQRWDFTRLDAPATMQATMTVTGLSAERWRATAATSTPQQIADALAAAHARARPGLKLVGEPVIEDDRKANVFKVGVAFEYPFEAAYRVGGLDVDFSAVEMGEFLGGPNETTRRTPWMLDMPRRMTNTIEVIAPQPFTGQAPSPVDVQDKHFAYSVKATSSGSRYSYTRKLERRSDEVLPGDLAAYRDSAQRARGMLGHGSRVMLVDMKRLSPVFAAVERKLAADGITEDDELGKTLSRHSLRRAVDTLVLDGIGKDTPLAGRVHASLAASSIVLGAFADALTHAERALALQAPSDDNEENRALALIGLDRIDEAYERMQAAGLPPGRSQGGPAPSGGSERSERGGTDTSVDRKPFALAVMADIDLLRGRFAQAETALRELVERSDGPVRSRALLKLYLAAEHQGADRGKTAVAPHVAQADATRFQGALLHFLDGRIDRDALLALGREDKAMERLNLAEAYYYIGARLAAQGQAGEALAWYERVMQTKAVTAREVMLAKLVLVRAGRTTVAENAAAK